MTWPDVSLIDLARDGLFTDGDWVESKDQDPTGDIRLTQLADVGVGEFRNRSDRWMRGDQAKALGTTSLAPGDILIARMPDPLARACVVPEGLGAAVTAVDVAILRILRDDVYVPWVMWALNSPQFRRSAVTLQSGTTRKRISRKNLANLRIPLPPIDAQRRIVAVLAEQLSRLDAADETLWAAHRKLDAAVSSLLMDVVPDADAYPSSWESTTVARAGKVTLGRQRHPDWHTGPHMRPYLRVANVFEDRIDASDLKEMHWPDGTFERFRLEDGDVLLNEGQTPDLLGRPAIYRGEPSGVAFTNSLLRFKTRADVLPEFALLVFRRHMRSGRFKRESRITTNIAHLSASRLKAVEFPIPPVEQQAQLVSAAQRQLEALARLDGTLTTARDRSRRLRKAILSAAFEGRLTPPSRPEPSGDAGLDDPLGPGG